jgi:hypothetical protein
MGPTRLLVGAAGILLVCAFLSQLVDRATTKTRPREKAAVADKPLGREGGFELIRRDRYLLLIALLTVLLNVVNTSGEYLFGRYVVEQANVLHRRVTSKDLLRVAREEGWARGARVLRSARVSRAPRGKRRAG